MNNRINAEIRQKKTKRQWFLFITGLIAVLAGVSVLGFFGVRKVYRELQKQKLMRENPVIEIADLDIKAPILEGTDNKTISRAVGHFTGTGDFGKGNYCIAGHSSTIYKEYFNNLKKIRAGMKITLYDKEKNAYVYTVKETFIVEPNETWILDDFGDNRITVVTCTDDGKQRQVVVGSLS
ncbi:class D sortase [uncultured Ruminococcus sp.]|uniref:class D sortase n=1 Tax=uncultured Ruminococcus sp. TaxID=165186 RepID=UPI002618533C|nr:class D sortase [uncultured Ruminococcus sp.]